MRGSVLDIVRYEAAHAVRGLRRAPGLTLAILLAFALGLGVNAATFAVVDRVYLQAPAQVARPAELRRLIGYWRATELIPSDQYTTTDLPAFKNAVAGLADVEGYALDTDVHFDR